MGFFECCHNCTKRHLGCHSECLDYMEQKKSWDKCQELLRKEAQVHRAKTDYLNDPVWRKKKYY